ncbi:MAG: helix-turn-helix domain-containing protein [Flavobacteriaceae bacterium]|nr:helix-turn-helix domain-containing protein [Flavobacteriaceae bacterium]
MYEIKELRIKGMVCRRCISTVRNELENLGVEVLGLELGKATISYQKDTLSLEAVKKALNKNEFEILNDDESKIIEKIKLVMIGIVDDTPIVMKVNLSDKMVYILGKDYTYISKLFSKIEGITLEKYFIHLKIEKAKEFAQYDQLNFTEIAYELGYSSVNYLSNQFKQITGMSMSTYKKLTNRNRKSLNEII